MLTLSLNFPLSLKLSTVAFPLNLLGSVSLNKPSEDPESKPLISYISWIKFELQVFVKDFPKVTKDAHRFAKEFNIVFQTYPTGFSDLY